MRLVLSLLATLSIGCSTIDVKPTEWGYELDISLQGDTSGVVGEGGCLTDRSTVEIATGPGSDGRAMLTHELDDDGAVRSRTWSVEGPDGRITERRNWSEVEKTCAMLSGGGLSESASAAGRTWLQRIGDVLVGLFGGAVLF